MLQFWFMGLGPVYPHKKTQNILIKNQNNLFEWFQPATQVVTGLINLGKTCSSNLNKLVQLHKKVIFLFQHNLQCRPLARRRSKRTKTLLLFCFKMPIALANRGLLMVELFLNGPCPASFSFILGLFKQTIQFSQQINVKKVSIRYWDMNS